MQQYTKSVCISALTGSVTRKMAKEDIFSTLLELKPCCTTRCSQEFWYILSGLDIQLEKSENDNHAHKKLVEDCVK